MLPSSTAVSQVQQYVRAQQGVIEVERAAPGQLLLTVGERVQATVTGQLPNGRFAVLVKDQLLDLNLPSNTQPGEQMDLTVVAKEPRLTFSLSPQAQAATSQTQSGVVLSKTAQLLADLAVKPDSQPRTAILQQSQPLFSGEPVPEALATQLASRLAESGLFYESHQAEWVNGDRQLQSLLREPQAKLPETATPLLKTSDHAAINREGVPSGPDMANKPGMAEKAPETQQPIPKAGMSTGSVPDERLRDLRSELPVRGNPDSTLPSGTVVQPEQGLRQLVQQQLALLENHPLVWQGQAWPGQALYWKTELQNEGHSSVPDADAERLWQTRLDLTLPNLGELGVVAVLREGQFSLRFEATDPDTVALLQEKQAILPGRFEAAGLNLAATQVVHHVDESES